MYILFTFKKLGKIKKLLKGFTIKQNENYLNQPFSLNRAIASIRLPTSNLSSMTEI